MEEREWLFDRFEAHRGHLRAVAYRMLGSTGEADDAVQEAWLRLSRASTAGVENLGGWLTAVVSRVCLDMLRARRSRREAPLEGPDVRVPDPIVGREDRIDPEQEALLADSVGLVLLVVLQALSPAERLAFVLHDMFGVPFGEISPIVGRSTTAARQLASRARRRVRGTAAVPDADLVRQREAVVAFLAAARGGLRGATRGTRRGRRAAGHLRRFSSGRVTPRPRSAGGCRGGALLLAAVPVRAAGAREWSRGTRHGSGGPAVLSDGFHGRVREDRRDRHTRRPRAPASPRPGGARRLMPRLSGT